MVKTTGKILLSLMLGMSALLVPSAAHAAFPTATLTEGQVFVFPSSVEFDWTASNVEGGTTIEIEYFGCGDQLAGKATRTANGVFTVQTDPGKLGPDWYRVITIEQAGKDTFSETEANTDPGLVFECSDDSEPLVQTWSAKSGPVQGQAFAHDTVAVTPTVLTEFGEGQNASTAYDWYVGTTKVASGRSLLVNKAWAGQALNMLVTVATQTAEEQKLVSYGKVGAEQKLVRVAAKKVGKVKNNPKVNSKVAVSKPALNAPAQRQGAVVKYTWKVGSKVVARTSSLKVKSAWKNKPLQVIVDTATKYQKEVTIIKYGKVRR